MEYTKGRLQAALREQAWGFVEWLASSFPGPLGVRLRYFYWKRRLQFLGKGVRFGVGVRIYSPRCVQIGDQCWIDDYVILIAGPPLDRGQFIHRKPNPRFVHKEGELVIGDYVHIAPFSVVQAHGGVHIGTTSGIASGSKIYSLSHHYRDSTGRAPTTTLMKYSPTVSPDEQALICSPVVVEDNSAVGLNCVILPGSTLSSGSWLGAGSLLCGLVPEKVIASGVPAQVVKKRFE